MSLIIKGMDMPEQLPDIADSNAITIYNCQIFIDSKGNASIRIRGHKEEYPIVKIPTPHGRLIDADRLKSMIEKYHCNGCDNYNGARCSACCVDDCFRYIDDIPTIIEAEGVNENS